METKNILLLSHLPPPATGIGSWTKRVLEIGLPNCKTFIVNTNTINGRDPFRNSKRNIFDEYKRTKNIYNQTKKILKENDIHIVHTCIPCTPLGMIREMGSANIAKKNKVPFVLHCRCTVPNVVNTWWKKIIFKMLLKKCSGVIVLNTQSYDFIKSLDKKIFIEIIPNFVDSKEIEIPKEKDSIKNIFYVGGVTEEKGADIIIKAAKHFQNITFHLIGNVEPKIEAIPKSNNVILYGMKTRDFVNEKLKQADLFLFLSTYWGEGFSNALVEAMAKGIPCIVSDWAANKDMIENKGGIILKNKSEKELIESIMKIRDDKFILNEFSKWNINKVKKEYIDSVVIPRYVKFYQDLIDTTEKNN